MSIKNNWASEASPTLGCSIEFRMIYIILIAQVRVEYGEIFHELRRIFTSRQASANTAYE